jgi:hypothetical protein
MQHEAIVNTTGQTLFDESWGEFERVIHPHC